jgi:hypothetical protein
LIADGEELKQGLVLDTKESEMFEVGSRKDTTMIREDNEIGDTGTLQEEHNFDGIQEEAHDNHVGMRTRSGRTMTPPSPFHGVTKIPEGNLMCRKTEKAILAELKQLFEDLQALHPVLKEDIQPNTKVLRSHMFVVEKYLACGKFYKLKARLVADGQDQNPEMFPNKSSSIVLIQLVLAVLGIILVCSWKVMVKMDIKGAYVQTPMT